MAGETCKLHVAFHGCLQGASLVGDAFYAQLSRTIRKEPHAVTRILHYGDSLIAADYLSGRGSILPA